MTTAPLEILSRLYDTNIDAFYDLPPVLRRQVMVWRRNQRRPPRIGRPT